jgi:hypothetical protein
MWVHKNLKGTLKIKGGYNKFFKLRVTQILNHTTSGKILSGERGYWVDFRGVLTVLARPRPFHILANVFG